MRGLTEHQKLKLQYNRILKANVSLQNENDLLRSALKEKLRNDPAYLNKLIQIREGVH
jgi:regulator of replication initiation timing